MLSSANFQVQPAEPLALQSAADSAAEDCAAVLRGRVEAPSARLEDARRRGSETLRSASLAPKFRIYCVRI